MTFLSAGIQPAQSVLRRDWVQITCSSWEMLSQELECKRIQTGQTEGAHGGDERTKSVEFISRSSARSWGLWRVRILRTSGSRDSSMRLGERERSQDTRDKQFTIRHDQCDLARHNIRYDTIHFDTIRNNGIWYNIIWYDTIRYRLIWYNTERYDTKRCDATRFNTNLSVPIVQYDTIWYDALWNEVITNMNWLINLSRRETERHYTNMTANSTTTPKANTFQGSTK